MSNRIPINPMVAMPNELVKASPHGIARYANGFVLPGVIADAGDHAAKRFIEFFTATIRNAQHAAGLRPGRRRFLGLVRGHGLTLPGIEPVHVAAYIEQLTRPNPPPPSSSTWPPSACCSTG